MNIKQVLKEEPGSLGSLITTCILKDGRKVTIHWDPASGEIYGMWSES